MIKRFRSAVRILLFFTALSSGFSYAAKLAIVIDDIGYHPKEDAAVYAMPKEISVAIIPSAPYARQRDTLAKQQGRDILIHLPMQPKNNQPIESGGLTLGMSQQEVDARLNAARKILPNAIGLNNHMGSAATSDRPLMSKLMSALRRHHLFFLDSRTIGSSVAGKVAKEQGIKHLDRHLFLDDSDTYADVQHQFQQSLRYARKHGTAVIIGHPRPNTIAVLQAGLRNLPEDIQLVSVGSLWQGKQVEPEQIKPFNYLFSTVPASTSTAPYEFVPGLRGMP